MINVIIFLQTLSVYVQTVAEWRESHSQHHFVFLAYKYLYRQTKQDQMASHAVNMNSNCIGSLTRKSNETKWKILEIEQDLIQILEVEQYLIKILETEQYIIKALEREQYLIQILEIEKYVIKILGIEQYRINTFTAIVDLSRFNNSCLKSPASTLVDLTFQSHALRSFSLNQLRNLSLQAGNLHSSFSISS